MLVLDSSFAEYWDTVPLLVLQSYLTRNTLEQLNYARNTPYLGMEQLDRGDLADSRAAGPDHFCK